MAPQKKNLTGAAAVPVAISLRVPWTTTLVVIAIVLGALAAYLNSFAVPFIFDDDTSITDNPTIRSLWPPAAALTPPGGGKTVSGRPVVNYSFAINYAFGGLHLFGYHVINLTIHICAGLALFGIVRRTLLQPILRPRFGGSAQEIAFVTAFWWLLHPLQTESVTYIVQRAESLMGFFYLFTLYASIRAMDNTGFSRWPVIAWVACLAGMASKEVMVTAPLMVLLYDRTFVAGTFRTAWDCRKWHYLSLSAGWVLLAWLVLGAGEGTRGGSIGFGGGITWWEYLCTQSEAIVRYLRLSIWPRPLVLDYGTYVQRNPAIFVPCMLFLAGLAIATVIGLWRRPIWAFFGVWFFAILAPSSSVVPIVTQTAAEHRMYLPLAAVLIASVIALHRWIARAFLPVGLLVGCVLGLMTALRNYDYGSAIAIWEDTAAKQPQAERAHLNLGTALMIDRTRLSEAIEHFRDAIRIAPSYYMAYANLGVALKELPGHATDAVAACEKAVAMRPDSSDAWSSLGTVLEEVPGRHGDSIKAYEKAVSLRPEAPLLLSNFASALALIPERRQEAIDRFREVIRLRPDLSNAHAGLGEVLLTLSGHRPEAIAELNEAIRLDPENVEAQVDLGEALSRFPAEASAAAVHLRTAMALQPRSAKVWNNIGVALARIPGRQDEAIGAFERAIHANPSAANAHLNFAMLLQSLPGREADALLHLEAAVKLDPDNLAAQTNLGLALADKPERLADASHHFEIVARSEPTSRDAHFNFGVALMRLAGRETEAIDEFQTVLRLDPTDADAHNDLGLLMSRLPGYQEKAREQFETALQLKPDLADARFNLAQLVSTEPGRLPEAIRHLESAIKLAPDHEAARELLIELKSKL